MALGERDPDALDFYIGPAADVAEIKKTPPRLPELRARAEAALSTLGALRGLGPAESERRDFLKGQLRAISARVDLLLGVTRTFDEETRLFFGIEAPPQANNSNLQSIRDRAVTLAGRAADPAHAWAVYESPYAVPPERLPAVMAKAVEACRNQTRQHLQLPAGERLDIEYVYNKPWSAYSYYLGHSRSLMRVNADYPLTIDRILDLACHEGYPGHHVFNSLRDEEFVARQHRLEFLVQPVFSPQSLLSEGAATVAPEIAFSEPARVELYENVLLPEAGLRGSNVAGLRESNVAGLHLSNVAGLPVSKVQSYVKLARLVDRLYPAELSIARQYLDQKMEFVRAGDALSRDALMYKPDAALRYLNEFRSYVVTYTEGRDRARAWLDNHGNGNRWEALRQLAVSHIEFH